MRGQQPSRLVRTGLSAVIFLAAALATAAPASAAPAPITGSVARGYTVLAVASNGRTTSTQAGTDGRFRLTPPARRVTLHLRGPAGLYDGPVVVADAGRNRVLLGVRAGARLGRIAVRPDYGRVLARVSRADVDPTVRAYAKKGKPRGAGRRGRVRLWPSLGVAGQQPGGATQGGEDADQDGLPGAFDVDDDGDLVLDNVDARANLPRTATDPFQPGFLLNVGLDLSYVAENMGLATGVAGFALNDNARRPASAGEAQKLRDLALRIRGLLLFPLPRGPAELDCGGLSYCSPGGSGRDVTRDRRFPLDFDPDGDEFGAMTDVRPLLPDRDGFGTVNAITRPLFAFAPATTLRGRTPFGGIGSGDAYIERFPDGSARAATLGYVFDTVPAVAAYDTGEGRRRVPYPFPRDPLGNQPSPIRLGPSRKLTLTVWRPQRRALPGEAGCPVGADTCRQGVDIGGLTYIVSGKTSEQNKRIWHCPASAYGVPAAGNATARATPDGVADLARDRPRDPSRTLTFTVDLARCPNDGEAAPWSGFPARAVYVTAVSRFGDAAEGGGLTFFYF